MKSFQFKNILQSSLFKSSGLYTIANILNASIPFLLMPILTRYLTPADYGIVAMYQVVFLFLNPFIGLNVNAAIGRKYYSQETIDLPKYIGNGLMILVFSTLVICLIFLFTHHLLEQYTSIPTFWLFSIILSSVGQFLVSLPLLLWQVRVKPIWYGIFQISQTLLNLGLSLFLVTVLKKNWSGRIEAQVISWLLFGLIGVIILYKNKLIKIKYDRSYIKDALKFGLPLIPHSVGWMFIAIIDRILLKNISGLEQTGVYTVAFQMGSIIKLITSSFNTAYIPWLFGKLNENEMASKIKIVKFTYIYFAALVLLTIFLYFFLPWFLSFFLGKDFQTANSFIIWIVAGFVFDGMYLMVTNYIFYAEKTHLLAWITFSIALINIPLNYFLISINSTLGAAQATFITFFLWFLATWILSAKVYKMPWLLSLKRDV